MVGNIVGNYKILQQIGEGGMGAVYKGVDLMLEREVAIKVLRPELARQPQIVERFRAEAVTLAKLNHTNIATLHSFFRQGDEFFMVMEFVRGETLDSMLRRSGGMSVEQAVPLFCQALEGIDHAHRLGIIHRDIKPANMMLTATPPVPGAVATGLIKVMDFGIARVLGTARMTRQGNVIGTIEYMSPEQVRGQETDARSDIYSLGILLYEMLTGRVPFHSESEFELMKSQIDDPPPPPRDFAPHISPLIEQAIMRALAKNPEARFQSAGALRAALLNSLSVERAAQGNTAGITGPTGSTGPMIAAGPSIPVGVANTGARGPASGEATPFPGQGLAGPGSAEHIKVTRLAPGDGSVKETRFSPGGSGPGAVQGYPGQPQQYGYPQPGLPQPGAYAGQQAGHRQGASLLSKLTWKHYAGAAAALMVVLVGGVLALVGFGGKQTPTQLPANTSTKSQGGSAPAAQVPQGDQTPATDQPTLGPPPDGDPGAKSAAAGGSAGSSSTGSSSRRRGSDAGTSSSSASSGSASSGAGAGDTGGATAGGGATSGGTTARDSGGSSHRASAPPPPRQPTQKEPDPPKEGKAAKVGGFLKKVGGFLQKKP
jgi:serine/threonine-protein kinase